MERIVAIVEGHLEYHFMKESYPRVLVQRCIPNGKNVDLDQIIEAISDQLEVIDNSFLKVVILLDRERRKETILEITDYLIYKLLEKNPSRAFYIGVADLMAENWILSDEDYIKRTYLIDDYKYCGDGVAGKSRLATIISNDLAPRDKARMLKAISPMLGSMKSDSLLHFISQIDFPWYWALK